MVEQLCSLDIVDDSLGDKVEGLDVLVAHMIDDEVIFDDDDDEMKKIDDDDEGEKRFVLVYDKDDNEAPIVDKQPRKRKRVRKRKKRL